MQTGIFPDPVDVEAVVGVEHAGLDGVEHLEGPDDRAVGETFDQQLALGHLGHLLAEVLELRVPDRTGVPAGLHLPFDRGRRRQAHHARESHDPRGGAGRHGRGLQETATRFLFTGDLFFFDFLAHGQSSFFFFWLGLYFVSTPPLEH